MCGIVAFYGSKNQVVPSILGGLKRLEYRGYDSSGIAFVENISNSKMEIGVKIEDKNEISQHSQIHSKSKIICYKAVGKVKELENEIQHNYHSKLLENSELENKNDQKADFKTNFSIGIGHTRWATHGVPSIENAHPHHSLKNDKTGQIYLIHNGIIENYQEIKKMLSEHNYTFYGQTDSEVLVNLIDFYNKTDFENNQKNNQKFQPNLKHAVLEALKKVHGAFAICVISEDEPDRLIAAKKGSPLVLGIGDSEFILASDVTPIIRKTRDVIYLEDGELVDIKDGKYGICNFENELVERNVEKIDWSDEQASKGGYEHFLLKEIMEQSQSAVDSCRGRLLLEDGNIKFGGLLDIQDRLKDIERVVLLGIGTSYYACKLGEIYFEDLAQISAKAEMSPEFRYKNPFIDDKTWVIAISQSGETKDTIEAIKEAKAKGALVTGIVNTVGSTISRITDAGVYNHIGPEISVASTKAFTSQSLILLMHAILLGRMRTLSLTDGQRLVGELINLPQKITETLKIQDKVKEIAQKYHAVSNLIYVAKKYNYPIALEGALKIKELSYIHAEGLSSGELKHGFIALIDENMPTIAICTKDSVYEKQLSSLLEIKARSGQIIAIATVGDEEIAETSDDVIFMPPVCEVLSPILNAIPMQFLAYYTSLFKGLDVDKPRNLAKSVTVE